MRRRRRGSRRKLGLVAGAAELGQLYAKELGPECIQCLCKQYLGAAPGNAPWELRSSYLREALAIISTGSRELTAPQVGHQLDELLHRMFGMREDRPEDKRRLNRAVMSWEGELWARVGRPKIPLRWRLAWPRAGTTPTIACRTMWKKTCLRGFSGMRLASARTFSMSPMRSGGLGTSCFLPTTAARLCWIGYCCAL